MGSEMGIVTSELRLVSSTGWEARPGSGQRTERNLRPACQHHAAACCGSRPRCPCLWVQLTSCPVPKPSSENTNLLPALSPRPRLSLPGARVCAVQAALCIQPALQVSFTFHLTCHLLRAPLLTAWSLQKTQTSFTSLPRTRHLLQSLLYLVVPSPWKVSVWSVCYPLPTTVPVHRLCSGESVIQIQFLSADLLKKAGICVTPTSSQKFVK